MTTRKRLGEILQVTVALLSIVGVLAALIVVPEVRQWIGLDQAATPPPPGTPASSSMPTPPGRAVLFDDDGSLDGTAALLFLLSGDEVDIQAVTVSNGEAHPDVYAQNIGRLLDDLGIINIPVGAGQDRPLAGQNSFPDWMVQLSDDFWTVPLPNPDRTYPVQDAVQLMVNAISNSPDPVTVFSSGPLTNLALALRTSPSIADNIEAVYVMGGALNVPGNIPGLEPDSTNMAAEWNLYVDPQAAHEVFASGLPLSVVPLDATNQVTINIEDTRLWRTGGKAAGYAADLYDHSFLNSGMQVTEIWDLLAAVVMTNPNLCRFEQHSLSIVTEQGDAAGQMVSQLAGAPNARVCVQPDPDLVRQTMIEVFSHSD